MRWSEKLVRFMKPKPKLAPPKWDEAGVCASTGEEIACIEWHEMTAVYAYKKDCFTVDQIRVIFASEKWNIEFTEDTADFDALRACMEQQLKVRPDWHQILVQSPAFETTWTVVYPYDSPNGSEIGK